MAVEAFLTPSESKLTVEKPVKTKPKIEELTKIEKPGNLQNDIELDKPKKKPKTSKPKASPKLEAPNKDTTLIVTEKPQAALKIASALSSTARKYSEGNVSYYELERNGKKIVVASAVGHLFNLTYAQGERGWPIFKLDWIGFFIFYIF